MAFASWVAVLLTGAGFYALMSFTVSLAVLALGMLACVPLTRRGLRIPPLEALRN